MTERALDLERGRSSYAQRAWAAAYAELTRADEAAPLAPADLELLAMAAYLIGRDDDYLKSLERAYRGYLDAREGTCAARAAFWVGLRLMFRGEPGQGGGWLARARRLVEGAAAECAEHGYLLVPLVHQEVDAARYDAAFEVAGRAARIGALCGDAGLCAVAWHLQGRARIRQGKVAEGLALLDEAMVAVLSGELSPLVTGLVYCSVIEGCEEAYALARAREWTAALARWCDEQPEMVAFSGVCRVHRAQIMELNGAWGDALAEARRASERCQGINRMAAGAAAYRQGEVYRLRGEFRAADAAYREASQAGWDPQPGLSLLRLAEGNTEAALVAIRRVLGATPGPSQRARFLPALVEISLVAGELPAARDASRELDAIAATIDAALLHASAAHARGALELDEGGVQPALVSLRRAAQSWQELHAPYWLARARVLMGAACRALGDVEGATLELHAARDIFAALGAAPELERLAVLLRPATAARAYGLTARELEVLRLVAAGKTNKAIAAALFLSDKTIDRHMSNIFNKLGVTSRAAATAFAYEHKLL